MLVGMRTAAAAAEPENPVCTKYTTGLAQTVLMTCQEYYYGNLWPLPLVLKDICIVVSANRQWLAYYNPARP